MHELNWGIPLVIDLFTAAMGAGAFMLAVMADLSGRAKYRTTSTVGALIAPWPAIAGVALLVIDLGKPLRFWEMMLKRGPGLLWLQFPYLQFNPESTMSIGTWVLTIFIWASFGYIALTILSYWIERLTILRKLMGLAGVPFAMAVTIYTGVLLAASPNPLWNNAMLPVLFVVSALVTGAAGVIATMAVLRIVDVLEPDDMAAVPKLEKMMSVILIVNVLVALLFVGIGLGTKEMRHAVGGGFGLLWWVGIIFLGMIVPMIAGLKGGEKQPQVSLVLAALVLMGGLFLRYVILVVGQIPIA